MKERQENNFKDIEYMFMRVIAYCLEYGDGIVLTQSVAAGNEPAVLIRDLTGRVTAWIEVGMPNPASGVSPNSIWPFV
jgi:uncharacterized protein YaeQ